MSRTPVDDALDRVEWHPCDVVASIDGIPHATHSGVLKLGTVELKVYQLSDGRRIIDAADLAALLSSGVPL